MGCGSEGGCEMSLELLLQLQVCHPGSLSHGWFFMVLIWARSQKVSKLWASSESHWHITASFDVSQCLSVYMCTFINILVPVYNLTPNVKMAVRGLTKVTPSSSEVETNFCPSFSSTNWHYRKALIQERSESAESRLHSLLTVLLKWLVKIAADDLEKCQKEMEIPIFYQTNIST